MCNFLLFPNILCCLFCLDTYCLTLDLFRDCMLFYIEENGFICCNCFFSLFFLLCHLMFQKIKREVRIQRTESCKLILERSLVIKESDQLSSLIRLFYAWIYWLSFPCNLTFIPWLTKYALFPAIVVCQRLSILV